MTYGDKRPYLVAVLVPEQSFIEEWATSSGVEANLTDLSENEAFGKALGSALNAPTPAFPR